MSAGRIRRLLRRRRIRTVTPERRDQRTNHARRGKAGGRPPAFNAERYKRRNQVERGFNRRKQFRAVGTRYDKLAMHYSATVTIAEIMDWLQAKPDRPHS
ncbi:transposase [Streptosporangium canum]|uniref:transposase n=1 Tax=Streptosporangium canum TaxID=324952 RepID=UPI0033BCA760